MLVTTHAFGAATVIEVATWLVAEERAVSTVRAAPVVALVPMRNTAIPPSASARGKPCQAS
jgi:hypothetical protein